MTIYSYAGINSAGFALDEMNGPGVNDTVYTGVWDGAQVFKPAVLTLSADDHQTVDRWVVRERRIVRIPRDRRRVRADGRRGAEVTQ